MTLGAWIALILLLWLFFDSHLGQQHNPNQQLEIRSENGVEELVLRRNRLGHYVAPALINGQAVELLVDTGATLVAVPARLGPDLGLLPGSPLQSMTANGMVTSRATRIDRLQLGPFLLRNVAASLNPGMQDDQILLGMSALKRFELIQRDGVLIVRSPQPAR